jgi:rfaE bifunctional protein kinase chain/domain
VKSDLSGLCPESKAALAAIKDKIGDSGKTIAFVSGYFNILHPGHLRLLRFAKECGDFLVVGVLSDGTPTDPLLSEAFRLENTLATSWVDFAFILKDSPSDFIQALQPAVVAKGNEFADQQNEEQKITDSYGGKLLFSSGDFSFSSIDLIRKEFSRLKFSNIEKSTEFPKRHQFSMSRLNQIIETFPSLNVAVIGDLIVDEYITCDPVGMSQEDPTLVITPILTERFLGAAGIVAAHAVSLGANVDFFSIAGVDENGSYARKQIEHYGVRGHVYEDESRPTTLKQRFRAGSKTLLRVNHFRQHEIGLDLQNKILKDIIQNLEGKQLLIFSDFNYGCLPQSLVTKIINHCKTNGIKMVADSQSSSQVGNIGRFHDMDLITPTEREARLAVQDFRSGVVVMTRELQEKSFAKNIFVTMGKEGLIIHGDTTGENKCKTDQLPAMSSSPVDVAGAGDSLLICASLALATGATIWESAYLGSLAAACQVSRLGNIPLSKAELVKEILA